MDYHSDNIIWNYSDLENSASMTKIMTSIIAFDLLKKWKLQWQYLYHIGKCMDISAVHHQCLLWLMKFIKKDNLLR